MIDVSTEDKVSALPAVHLITERWALDIDMKEVPRRLLPAFVTTNDVSFIYTLEDTPVVAQQSLPLAISNHVLLIPSASSKSKRLPYFEVLFANHTKVALYRRFDAATA